MLLLDKLANTKWCKTPDKALKPWHVGTHLRVLCEGSPMSTNMTGFIWFSKNFCVFVNRMKVALALEGFIKGFKVSSFNSSNAKATYVLSTRMQRFLKNTLTLPRWYSLDSSCWVLKWVPMCPGLGHFFCIIVLGQIIN